MSTLNDFVGQVFDRLTVISYEKGEYKKAGKWICKCSCGNTTKVYTDNLLKRKTSSCGCLHKELSSSRLSKRLTTHGKWGSSIYKCWESMKSRCSCVTHTSYKNYGARGISVCERWMSFDNFYADMGDKPKGMTLERIDNNKGYSPDNCKWASTKEQSRNKKNNHNIDGMCLTDWAKKLNIHPSTLSCRLKKGFKITNTTLTESADKVFKVTHDKYSTVSEV